MTIATKIKRALKPVILRAADAYLMTVLNALAPARKAAPQDRRHVLALAPAVYGNLGDEAIVVSFLTRLRRELPEAKITLIIFADKDVGGYGYLADELGVEFASLQGFFGMTPMLGAVRRMTDLIATGTDFVILGTDVLDGGYDESYSIRRWYMGVLAVRAGLPASAVGFSFSDRATAGVKAFVRTRCAGINIICRDAVSAARLSKAAGRTIPSSADIAFLLPLPAVPTPAAAAALAAVEDWRAEGRKIIMFNVNPTGLTNALPGIDVAACARASSEAVRMIAEAEPCAFVFAPHDNRAGVADFLNSIKAVVPNVPVAMLDGKVRPGDFKLLGAKADLTITGRMHMGIASMGVGTPTLFQDYQGKVEGLLALFELPDMKYDAEDVLAPERLTAMAADRLARHGDIVAQIAARIDGVRALSARNIDLVVNGKVAP
jgi:polysaccharide pyruvyl transferase WcaK-like protein